MLFHSLGFVKDLRGRLPALLVAVLVAAVVLSACGGDTAPPAVDDGGQPTAPIDAASPATDGDDDAEPTSAAAETSEPTQDDAATEPAETEEAGGDDATATGTDDGGGAAGGAALAAIRERGVLRAGVKYDAPPFGSLDPVTNEVTGFDIDIVRGLAERILGDPNAVELVQVTSQNRIPQLQNGRIDLFAATATITPERLEEIDFSDVYYRAGQSLLVRTDSDIQSYEDLSGRTVCSVTGSTPEQTIRRLVPDVEVTLFETYPECLTSLQNNRVDAITTDNVLLAGLQQQDPQNLKLVGGLFTFEPYGMGIAQGNDDLREAVNDALREMEEDGAYAEIYQRWLNEPLPDDFEEWFLLDAEEAAQQFEDQVPGEGAAPGGGDDNAGNGGPEVEPTAGEDDGDQ